MATRNLASLELHSHKFISIDQRRLTLSPIMDYRPGQVDEVDHLLSAAPTTQRPDASCNHPDYNSFEKDEEAGHLSDELGKVRSTGHRRNPGGVDPD